MAHPACGDTLEYLQKGLPKQIDTWRAEAEDRIYNGKTIFSYINGGAEVYKAYNMQRCLSRRYVDPKGSGIVLDIFDMKTPEDAFGVFTHDTEGKAVSVGRDARYRPGWLSFWKHRFFVSIYMEEESAAAEKAVMMLGKDVSAGIRKESTLPKIVSMIPQEGLQSDRVRYLHHPVILNYHFYLADDNILNISANTDAVLAPYRRGNASALLLLVLYPDAQTAKAALTGMSTHYLPDADRTGAARLENGKWAAAALKERLLAVILESETKALAERLLKAVQY